MPTPTHTNRLARETSPYLLQHAHNPVDWYAWGDEAFDAARSQDKPIFLSVGYSTCYWCHVMERESFEDEATAEYMNAHFINIKVDREERPDVDDIYMAAVQALNRGQGGWPMSVFLEPQSLKPFFAGTYYPPQSPDTPAAAHARPTFPDLLRFIDDVWQNRRDDVIQQSDQIAAFLTERLGGSAERKPLDGEIINRAIGDLMRSYDAPPTGHGGFGSAPKFPQPVFLDLLIDTAWSDEEVRHAVCYTLTRMAMGGMYDQVGGGFHRYSVDARWLVPHFEKMLYDNAQLLSTYSRAHALTGDPFCSRIIRGTAEYVLREMTADGGAFFSAQDAEVDAREGLSYLWTVDEVSDALTAAGLDDDIAFALDVYGLSRGTNFQDPHHPSDPPRNVLYLTDTPQSLAASRDLSLDDFFASLDRINIALLDARNKRDQPATDDKVLTGWNGLMIAGFADAGRALDEPRYIDAASKAALFLMEQHRSNRHGLLRSSRDGSPGVPAVLEDSALLAHGLLALARATGRDEWTEAAMMFIDDARKRFWNDDGGGYFDTRADQTDLFVRTRNLYDGAVPSGNSVMAMNLLDLADQSGRDGYVDDAIATLGSMSSRMHEHPPSLALGLRALHRALDRHAQAAEALAQAASDDRDSSGDDSPVQMTLEPKAITFDERGDAEAMLTLEIADDYHINAHEPGTADVQPLQIDCATRGIEIEPHYPVGDGYDGPASGGQRIRVHTGTTRIPITLRSRDREVPDTIAIAVTCQPCTDTACLRPRTMRFEIHIDR